MRVVERKNCLSHGGSEGYLSIKEIFYFIFKLNRFNLFFRSNILNALLRHFGSHDRIEKCEIINITDGNVNIKLNTSFRGEWDDTRYESIPLDVCSSSTSISEYFENKIKQAELLEEQRLKAEMEAEEKELFFKLLEKYQPKGTI